MFEFLYVPSVKWKAVSTARMEGGYPERRGQPECQVRYIL